MNLKRRHLTYDQRVGLGLKILPLLAAEAAKRSGGRPRKDEEKPSPKSGQVFGKSAKQVAQQVGVGRTAIMEMAAEAKENPEIVENLVQGKTTVKETRKDEGKGAGTAARYPAAFRVLAVPCRNFPINASIRSGVSGVTRCQVARRRARSRLKKRSRSGKL